MPVTLEPVPPTPAGVSSLRERRLRRGAIGDRGRRLTVGLINNMPDTALAATERQFLGALEDGAGDFDVRVSLFTLETAPRAAEAAAWLGQGYRGAAALAAAPLDALIITGAEPRAARLADEPYWRELTAVFDRARAGTLSTILSCLAAHAAVLHWDGVERQPLARKLSGVYAARRVLDHPLLAGLPESVAIPHSRWNGLDEAALAASGYRTLSRSDEAGLDVAVKDEGSLIVLLHGHPEYDGDSLAREFRRDLKRFVAGERATPPEPPAHYFAPAAQTLAEALVAAARDYPGRDPVCAAARALIESTNTAPWREAAARLYGNWLGLVAARKAALQPPSFAVARWGG